jgi:broad specificity phosphatase PhoE
MPKDESFDVLLVRSGDTPWTAEQRIQGHTDLPLTDDSRAALEAHFDAIDIPALNLIASGKEESTIATAQVLASHFDSSKHKKISDLHEINLGLWEGLVESVVQDRYAKAYTAWLQDPTTVTPPDGESLADVEERVCKAIRKLLEKASNPLAIVVRPIVWAFLICRVEDRPLQELWEIRRDAEPTVRVKMSTSQFKPRKVAAESSV